MGGIYSVEWEGNLFLGMCRMKDVFVNLLWHISAPHVRIS